METTTTPTITQFEEFISSNYKSELEKLAETYPNKKTLEIDFKKLEKFDPELADELIEKPYAVIQAAQDAVKNLGVLTADEKPVIPIIRFKNLPADHNIPIRNLNSDKINKFFSVNGIVTKITEVKPKIINAVFECKHCGRIYNVEQSERSSRLNAPLTCTCERTNFQLLVDESMFIDIQKLEIQEPLELLRGGEQPKRITVWIEEDLTNRIVPGNKLEITGTMRLQTPKQRGAVYDTFIDANNVIFIEKEFEELELTDEDREKIKELSNDPHLYEKIIKSIATSIYGHNEIKEAIALQLLGGTPGKIKPEGMKIRPDMHILLIGDPGCLVGDERVALGNGAIAKISELGKEHLQEINVPLLTGQGYTRDTATTFHAYKNQPVIEIITETGKSIKGTYNHPLLVAEGRERKWKRLDEIKHGDRLAAVPWIPCTITAPVKTSWLKQKNKFGPKPKSKLPAFLTPDTAGLIGYVLGDGWVQKHRVCFLVSPDELDILSPLVSTIERQFGIKPSVREIKLKRGRTKKMTEVDINDKDVANCLSFLKEKRVPPLIMKSGNKAVAEFLSWLFEADGCVFSKGRGRRAVQLKSASIELLRDTQMLLLRFGVHSRINERNLVIRRAESIKKFSKSIGFKSIKKTEKLKKLVEDCRKLREQNLRGKQLSEKVVSVKKAGCADVYDVEIPYSHRFIANGIISHNTAKTQLLRYVNLLAPKGLYVSGKSSSAAGLTATAEKDEFAEGGWTLKAGAIVLAAGGMAMIDEFDKMSAEDQSSMHEAMESQEIHVAKAGIITTFKANTAILAAANPKYGRFDPYSTPAEQFNIPVTIMSRFDLIFPIKDILNEKEDQKLAETILTSHYASGMRVSKKYDEETMRKAEETVMPVINPDLLRKYISHARKEFKPVLTDSSMDKLKEFYLNLRKLGQQQGSVSITPRYLEGLIRLAEASAKGRLSQTVEIEDAERSIRLLTFCLKEIGIDPETGRMDIDIIATGIPKSKTDKIRNVLRVVKALNEQFDEAKFESILEEVKKDGIQAEDLNEILSKLKREGDVYSPKYDVYKLPENK